ncbi:hypothetical protein M8994_19755 [Brucella sp. 21LCYQ03]|nr:hypothetical protein [Brucella sp. 21LCYQ03]
MSGPVDNGSKQNPPGKFHKTLSRAEFKRRNDALHKRLAKALTIKGQAYFKAREEWPEKIAAIEADEKLIAQWHKDHRRKKRFAKRQNEEIYPWGQKISPTRYSAILRNRREKLQLRLDKARTEYENAAQKLQSQIRSIREGIAWLEKNPAKIKAKKSLLNGHPYARLMCTDGREHIVIRGVHFQPSSGSFIEEIISDDEDEIVLLDPWECRGIRKLAGIRDLHFFKSDALLGDGVSDGDSFRLVGKTGDFQYLIRSINYHFFGSIEAIKSGEVAPRFNDNEYYERRHEITKSYLTNALASGAVMAGIEPATQTCSVIDDELPLSKKFKCSDQHITPRIHVDQSLELVELYSLGDIVSDGELNKSRCNPSAWTSYNDELRRALLTLDAGCSFIIEGAAGTGKTQMIPAMINYCLAAGKSVKVIAGTDTLDVIEKRCHAFMTEGIEHKFPIGWAREKRFLIFGPRLETQSGFGATGINSGVDAHVLEADFERPSGDFTDVLIIDDASRLGFEPSVDYHPFQLVILGDPAQVRCHGSVFDVARSLGFSRLYLPIHYRARNRDLMAWPNIFSYDNALVMQNRGMRQSELHYVGVGRKRDGVNKAEVRALVNAAKRLSSERATLGIVAFSQKQLNAINAALEKTDLSGLAFVGLPEDIQGREADHVLVSLNVALTPTGRIPLEIDGLEDEQRMAKVNVALSRARWRTILFSGLLATDIDLRIATDAQALIASVLQAFESLPSQKRLDRYGGYLLE